MGGTTGPVGKLTVLVAILNQSPQARRHHPVKDSCGTAWDDGRDDDPGDSQQTLSRIVCRWPPHGRQGLALRRPGDGRGDGERRAVDDWLRRRSTVAMTLIAG